jgi:hypothetical protein
MRSYNAIVSVRWKDKVHSDTYLYGDTSKGEEVEFQETNQDLVELVHRLIIDHQHNYRRQCPKH